MDDIEITSLKNKLEDLTKLLDNKEKLASAMEKDLNIK